jgi:nicotinate-nucleotide adenylyltransferase
LPPLVAARRGAARRIGLLGGSFNPAHAGHRHISLLALRRLKLDQVWWLVSPQNPLKSRADMDSEAARLESARRVARHPQLVVTDLESRIGTVYTADTLAAMRRLFPRTCFVWLMGADNLRQINRWQRWQTIFASVPVAVFARPTYDLPAKASLAAHRFASARAGEERAAGLAGRRPPAWLFLHTQLHAASATAIREAVATGRLDARVQEWRR